MRCKTAGVYASFLERYVLSKQTLVELARLPSAVQTMLVAQGKDEQAGSWGDLLSTRYRRIMLLAAGIPLFQQGSGINTVIYYSSQVRALHMSLISSAPQSVDLDISSSTWLLIICSNISGICSMAIFPDRQASHTHALDTSAKLSIVNMMQQG